MRLLVVDSSQLMGWLVERLAPPGVTVLLAGTFREALGILRDDPPSAAIISIGPIDLPWHQVCDLCQSSSPPIPFLCCSAVEEDVSAIEHMGCSTDHFFCKPIPVPELRARIEMLVDEARRVQDDTV